MEITTYITARIAQNSDKETILKWLKEEESIMTNIKSNLMRNYYLKSINQLICTVESTDCSNGALFEATPYSCTTFPHSKSIDKSFYCCDTKQHRDQFEPYY